MTRIALLSDTHGYLDDRISRLAAEADQIWHAGDFGEGNVTEKLSAIRPFKAVYGNIDGQPIRKLYPEYLFFKVEKVGVLMIHIAGPFGSYTPQTKSLIQQHQPKLLVCGHSHILKVAMDQKFNLLYMNPGAAGKHGFHKMRTMLRFSIDGDNITQLEAIELGMRGSIS